MVGATNAPMKGGNAIPYCCIYVMCCGLSEASETCKCSTRYSNCKGERAVYHQEEPWPGTSEAFECEREPHNRVGETHWRARLVSADREDLTPGQQRSHDSTIPKSLRAIDFIRERSLWSMLCSSEKELQVVLRG